MFETATFIGFGEAGRSFAEGLQGCRAYDSKTDIDALRQAKLDDYAHLGVEGCSGNAEAVGNARLILSLVTADRALAAATETARAITPGALYLDMNSVAPETKRQAATVIETVGGRYVDVAVMAPVHPHRRSVPLLVSGPHAEDGLEALRALGFVAGCGVGTRIGDAAAIKMIRSVMIKGIEALSAECILAAEAAGVTTWVIQSLDGGGKEDGWAKRFDYNLDRMIVHGTRRAAEMEEAVKTLMALGTGAAMTRATVERQRAIGARSLDSPRTLGAKLAALLPLSKDQAT